MCIGINVSWKRCNTCAFLLFVLVLVLIVPRSVFAADLKFGSDVDKRSVEISPGGKGVFEVSFLNLGDVPISVGIDAECAGPLEVSVITDRVIIPSAYSLPATWDSMIFPPKRWYLLDDGVTHIPVYNAYISVQAPDELYVHQLHDYTLRVSISASSPEGTGVQSIRENIVQVHDYKLILKLSPDFENNIRRSDDRINLSFYKKGNEVLRNKPSKPVMEDGSLGSQNDSSVIYVNEIQPDVKNELKIRDSGKVQGSVIMENTDGKGKDIFNRESATTIAILVICCAALLISIGL